MTNRLLPVLLGLVVAVAGEDRTFKGATSPLTQLINPGPQGPYPPAQPEPQYGVPAEHQMYGLPQPQQQPEGFTVQSGYEGFIFPTGPEEALKEHSALGTLGSVALGAKLLTHLLPFPLNKIALFFATKLGLWLLGLMLVLLVGGATTTAVCAFTPLCTISFLGLGAFNRESTRALLTPDRLNQATQLVHDALDKYKDLQERMSKSWEKKRKLKKEEVEAREGKAVKTTDLKKEEVEAREGKAVKTTDLEKTKEAESPKKNSIEKS